MHVHLPKEPVYDERKQLIQQFGFAAFIGILLFLNVTGIFNTVAGIDTAAILTLIAGYRTFFTAISGLLQRCFPPFYDRKGVDAILESFSIVAGSIPCFRFPFVPDEAAVEFVRRTVEALPS